MNKKQPSLPKSERRHFLKGVAVVGGATALTKVSAGIISKDNPREKIETELAKPSKGYQETPHVKAYYQSLRDA